MARIRSSSVLCRPVTGLRAVVCALLPAVGFLLGVLAPLPQTVLAGDRPAADAATPADAPAADASAPAGAAAKPATRPKRVLLVSQGPDGHPPGTHEYVPGVRILVRLLQRPSLQLIPVQADDGWQDGPELIDSADGVVLFVSEGARWVSSDAARLAAFQRLAQRGGGLAVLHWGMGTRSAEPVKNFVALFGGCHGGPDRRYKIVETTASPASATHPVLRGITPFAAHDEFYYQLKFAQPPGQVSPLLQVSVEGKPYTVAWGWNRPAGGRSFGFSGLHFHRNWQLPEYQRLVAQGVLWTLKESVPEVGVDVLTDKSLFKLPARQNRDEN